MLTRKHPGARRLGMAGAAFGITVLAVPAPAQVLEEVVVTAQKREQEIQDVGIAITAFSGEQMSALGFTESTDIAQFSPGVNVAQSSAGQSRSFSIRGVTQNDFADHTEAPNAVYIDEGYIASAQGQVFGTFDLERIEVLKGPQGTLFGRNATGGLVHYITKKPTQEFEAFGDISYGRYNSVRFEGAVNGGLTPALAGRLSVFYNRFDEVLDNNFPEQQPLNPLTPDPTDLIPGTVRNGRSAAEDAWNDDHVAVRGQLLWDVSEKAQWLASGFYSLATVSTGPYQSRATIPVLDANGGHINTIYADQLVGKITGNCEGISAVTGTCLAGGFPTDGDFDNTRPREGGDLWGYIDADGKGFDTSMDFSLEDFNRYEVYGTTHKGTFDFDPFDVTVVLNYMEFNKRQALDVDAAPVNQSLVVNNSQHDEFTAELRFTGEFERAKWVAGMYYLWIDVHREQSLPFPAGSIITQTFGLPPAGLEAPAINDLETNSYSLFGQLDIDLTDSLVFIAGLRTIWEYKDSNYENPAFIDQDPAVVDNGSGAIPVAIPSCDPVFFAGCLYPTFTDKHHKTLWTGKVQMNWSPTDDILLYAGINRGVKGFGYNGKLNDFNPPVPANLQRYKEEVLLAYEVGIKSTWFGGTTRVNANYYYYDYSDYQAFVFVGSSGVITNADATYQGIELEVVTNPIDNLDLMFTASFIDAEVHGLNVAPNTPRNVKPSFTPSVQLAALGRYEWPGVAFGGDVAVQVDGQYVSSRFHNLRNYQGQKMEAYALGNARLSWYSSDEKWEVQGFITNFTDERYLTTGFDLSTLCGCNEESYGLPRWYGVKLRYTWN